MGLSCVASGAGLKCVTQLSCAMGLSCAVSGAGLAYAVMLRLRRAWAAGCRRPAGMHERKR